MDEIGALKQAIQLIVDNKELIGPALLSLFSSFLGVCAIIQKITPNETTNKYLGYGFKLLNIFTIHATPTKVIKK